MFLGIPEYLWKSIFSVAEILIIGLILGFFAVAYQKRKETEYYLQGEIAKHRIDAYKKIIENISGIYHSIAPSLKIQVYYEEFLDGLPFRFHQLAYPSFMNNEKEFDDYYRSLSNLCVSQHIFLDGQVEYLVNNYQSYLSEIKRMLDAFSDLVNEEVDKAEDETGRRTDMAYKCFGIVLENDFAKYYSKIDEIISYRVSHLKIGFRKKRLILFITRINNGISDYLATGIASKNCLKSRICGFLFGFLFRNKLDYSMVRFTPSLLVLLMRIYYSDRYTPEEFDSLDETERNSLLKKFHRGYVSQLNMG